MKSRWGIVLMVVALGAMLAAVAVLSGCPAGPNEDGGGEMVPPAPEDMPIDEPVDEPVEDMEDEMEGEATDGEDMEADDMEATDAEMDEPTTPDEDPEVPPAGE